MLMVFYTAEALRESEVLVSYLLMIMSVDVIGEPWRFEVFFSVRYAVCTTDSDPSNST